ncbi:MAG: hypothetical protein ACUVQQ_13395 [Thermogutta sp.]
MHLRNLEFALPAVILAAYLAVWLVPTLRETAAVRRRMIELQPGSAGAAQIQERIQQAAVRLENVEEFLRPWRSQSSPEIAVATFLREVTLSGESEGLSFNRITPRSIRNIGWISENEIELRFSGKTENILRFLRTLDGERRPTVVKSVLLTRDPGSNRVACDMELLVFSDNSNYSD